MSHNIELKEGAFVVSDAHYSHIRPEFLDFLKAIHAKQLQPTQLILMGDIFDTLFGNVPYTQEVNSQAVSILNEISQTIEVIYLEGNHDFNLKKVFPKVKVFGIKEQPLKVEYGSKKVLLAHGDIESPLFYNIYTSIVRNPFVISVLNILDSISRHLIINRLDEYLSKKDDCKEFRGFREFIEKRLDNKYQCNYFIEGHFHQNKMLELEDFRYINLAAFACNQRYFIVKSFKDVELLEENIFSIQDDTVRRY
ncbi:Metallophosphoesterase [Sulfurimonas gotlandica GD1]|jgi:UDP-2,3-diacylglucosamine hydrolase|uniref:Metallophosphoesterase n=1 Tax=Sulfurimonas gotlandica (strain DSM 19862 / JCM 16533 / GD1) TaxID=929558 RepID=B6BKS3_SULGG|nr:metallophosphoesterase [Sulfurimonas gotlandica]EDZ62440.1 metallophosphoesterase [Sulfurimonas gotlandica GD1]EHP29133.1 Metallophosphoesterase [Sulfurimonas gotlandica GD1]